MDEKPKEPKPYSISWFLQELVKGIFIAIALFMLQIAGTGILQAYLLPERMDKEAEKIQKKFDDQIKAERASALKRESELIEELENLKKQYSEGIKAPGSFDPEKRRLRWLQEHASKD
jgi:hypothetical protein